MNKLGEVMLEVSEEWFADLPAPEEVPAYTYSKKYLKWEQEVIYGKKHVTLKRVAKVLLVAAILIIMLAVIALSTTKGRKFIMQFFKESAVYSIHSNIDNTVSSVDIGFIPKHYQLAGTYYGNMIIYKEYVYGDYSFVVYKSPVNTSTDFDYNDDCKKYFIDGITYVVSLTDKEYCNVIWNYNNFNYRISGNINVNEAMKIAKSVK